MGWQLSTSESLLFSLLPSSTDDAFDNFIFLGLGSMITIPKMEPAAAIKKIIFFKLVLLLLLLGFAPVGFSGFKVTTENKDLVCKKINVFNI